jgi:hypothetical protein
MPVVWPDIPFPPWRDTCAALHLYAQIVGKYRLARTPWLNHSWHATLYVTPRGLTTSLVPDAAGGVEVAFDLLSHEVTASASDGRRANFPLGATSVASFEARFRDLLRAVGATQDFDEHPNEIAGAVPFAGDRSERPYDAGAVTRFFHALVAVDRVLKEFRTGFLGKCSPVHLFWGSFDLAVTRFSGRRAPMHPGGVPGLPDEVTREAYSHEVSSAGFWPGGGGVEFPAFYSYAYPAPAGFADARIEPEDARFEPSLGEFVLPYESVRRSADPEATLIAFLQGTYDAAANLGRWDRANLECAIGEPRRVRPT